ncbi:hypothetical protein GCM10009745_68930 [Kribbella yunnanensis]|uniref:DUF3558 domain-containing protein n=1 Tax=Kribbella yunnanensis TaxID=190194 RepID=A0ABN2ITE1_9ACTN
MASRVVRGTAIAAGVAAVVGGGVGFALGKPVQEDDVVPARKLAADLCARIGDVSALLPKASGGRLVQSGTGAVTCTAVAGRQTATTFSTASVKVTITPYGGKLAGAGEVPYTPEAMAKKAFDRSPFDSVPDRPYPTKSDQTAVGLAGESFTTRVLVQRADVVVLVEYTANPVLAETARQAATVVADRAIWETK